MLVIPAAGVRVPEPAAWSRVRCLLQRPHHMALAPSIHRLRWRTCFGTPYASAFNGVARLQRLNLSEDPAARVLQSRVCRGPRKNSENELEYLPLGEGSNLAYPCGIPALTNNLGTTHNLLVLHACMQCHACYCKTDRLWATGSLIWLCKVD